MAQHLSVTQLKLNSLSQKRVKCTREIIIF